MSNLQLYSAFDAAALHFGPPEKTKMGGMTVNVYTQAPDGSRRRATIQTPPMVVPFGLSAFTDKNTGEIQSYSIDVSFKNSDTDPKIADFLTRMRALDETLLATAVARSPEWFGGKKNKDLIKEFLRELVQDKKVDRNGKPYPAQMKTKVPMKNGEPNCPVYDETRQAVTPDYITKGSSVKMILELTNVWFVGKASFGVTWRVIQVAVLSRPRVEGYAFCDDEEEDAKEVPPAEPIPMLDG